MNNWLTSKYTYLWIIWILGFGAIEWAALKNDKPGDTLSEHVWNLIGSNATEKRPWHWFLRIAVLSLLVWLIVHFSTKWTWFKKDDK